MTTIHGANGPLSALSIMNLSRAGILEILYMPPKTPLDRPEVRLSCRF